MHVIMSCVSGYLELLQLGQEWVEPKKRVVNNSIFIQLNRIVHQGHLQC